MNIHKQTEQQQEPQVGAEISQQKASTKLPKAKNMLLQTYFTSLLCLVFCVAMFLGTSYAWFTSEVSNDANEIYVGTLKVGLLKESQSGDLNLENSDNKLFNRSIRWEPGYTAIETIKVVNKGDLAFKYVLSFTDGTLENANGRSLSDVAKYFDLWVFDHRKATYVAPTSYEGISESTGWMPVGNLADVLDGKPVLEGNMVTVRQDGQDPSAVNPGTTDGVGTVDKYSFALHMKETAESDVMGRKIVLSVKLVAYQLASEKDAFGDDYDDKQVFVDDHEDLKDSMDGGKNIVLTQDIIIPQPEYCLMMDGNMLDGNNKKIIYTGGRVNDSQGVPKSVGVLETYGGTITNLTIEGSNAGRALYMRELKYDLIVSNCVLSGEFSFNLNSSQKNDTAIISFADTVFKSQTSYANAAVHAYFKNCTFAENLRPYGDSTLTGCTFAKEGIDISEFVKANAKDETITLINCTYNGQLIEKAVLQSNGDGTITITETELLEVVDNFIVLKSNS